MPLLTETLPRPARRAPAAGVVCLLVTMLVPAGMGSAQVPAYQWEPTGISVEGGGAIPFYGGLGSGDRGPRVRLADLDDDGDLDLYALDKDAHILTYENTGTAQAPVFHPAGTDLLGHPVTDWFLFDDLDADGDLDVLGGTAPQGEAIGFFRNVGGPGSPLFAYEAEAAFLDSVQVIPRLGNTPVLADLDGDGDHDIFYVMPDQGIGAFHRNDGTPTAPTFRSQTLDYGGLNTFIQGKASRADFAPGLPSSEALHGASIPLLFDTDFDGDQDLLIGDQFNPNVWCFANDGGTDSAEFVFVTQALLDLPVDTIPLFLIGCEGGDLDDDGLHDLVVAPVMEGQLARDIYFYKNVGSADSAVFTFTSDTLISGIDLGARACPALGDVDADGDLDMVASHVANGGERGLVYFENIGTSAAPAFRRVTEPNPFDAVVHDSLDTPSPAFADMDGDLDLDLLVGQGGGLRQVLYFENEGTPNTPQFTYMGNLLDPVRTNFRRRPDTYATPTTGDLDRDGDLDLLVGEFGSSGRPQMYWYRNLGIPSATAVAPLFEWVTSNADSAFGFDTVADSVRGFLVPLLIDRNGDGYLDIVIGSEDGRLREYRSHGEGDSLQFDRVASAFDGVDVGRASAPAIADIDGDGDSDLIVGEENGGLNLYRFIIAQPTVEDFIATPGDTTMTVGWTAVAVADTESVYRLSKSEEGGPFLPTSPDSFSGGSQFLFNDPAVFPGNAYSYLLVAAFPDSDETFGPAASFLPIPALSLLSSDLELEDDDQGVQILWTVSRSFPGLAFRLSRRFDEGPFVPLAGAESLFVGASGSFFDPDGDANSSYRLEGLYRKQGVLTAIPDSIFAPALIGASLPAAFKAYPARPNPSGAGPVQFVFDLPQDAVAHIAIFDVSGRRVAEVGPAPQSAGVARSLIWDGRNSEGDEAATGLYLYQLTAGPFSQTGRFVRLR